MIKIDWNPPPKMLRLFSLATCLFAGLVGAWLRWSHGVSWTPVGIVWGAGVAVLFLGLAVPRANRPLYVLLNAIFFPVGLAVSTAVVAVIYYVVLTPIGLVMRLLGYDPMGKRFDERADTYWTKREPPDSVKRYFRQY